MRTEEAMRVFGDGLSPITINWSEDLTAFKSTIGRGEISREYFRFLRAAEMEAWEMTGGDYVRSAVLSQTA